MKVGFTGTRDGLTCEQHASLVAVLKAMAITEFHHGCCVGADQEMRGTVKMKRHPNKQAERYRLNVEGGEWAVGTNNGAFEVPSPEGPFRLKVIVSCGGGWDHVSVSLPNRCPTWLEMCAIKDLFFRDDEVAMQLHPAKADYINCHTHCLHLWRPQTEVERVQLRYEGLDDGPNWPQPGPIPLPPTIAVGPNENQ